MVPLKLTVENFLCYRGNPPTLDLEGVHMACLCGQNGHGKSALLDAITWALWGKARGKSQDDLIYHGLNEMQVDLEFLAQDTRYRVVRRHARSVRGTRQGASDLQLQISTGATFRPITANTMRECQAQIEQVIGFDYDTFINSAFLVQGRADEFTNKSPGERKEVLSKVLKLGYFDTLQIRAKERVQERSRAAASLVGTLQHMGEEVLLLGECEVELETIIADLAEVTAQLNIRREELDLLKIRIDTLRRHRSELGEWDQRICSMNKDVVYFQEEVAKCESMVQEFRGRIEDRHGIGTDIEGKLVAKRKTLTTLVTEEEELVSQRFVLQQFVERIGQLKAQEEQVKSDGQELRSKLSLLGKSRTGAHCPVCDAELGSEGHEHLSQSYSAQIEEKRRLYIVHQDALDTAGKDKLKLESELSTKESALSNIRNDHEKSVVMMERELEIFRASQQEAKDNFHQVSHNLDQSKQMLDSRRAELAQATAAHTQKQAALEELPSTERGLRSLEVACHELERRRENLLPRKGALESQLVRIRKMTQEIEQESIKLRTLNYEVGLYQELVQALGRQGVQAMLIDEVLPHLETEANIYLSRMTDNRMSVKLETQKERKSRKGEPIETLEIKIGDELGLRSYEMFSGGEAFRINLALRIALSKILAYRRGAPLLTLFIDEGFGTQDSVGRDRILDVLGAIEADFQKIIVITHLDELKEHFPVHIEVLKEESGSTYWLN